MTLVDGLARLLAGDEVPTPVALPPGVTIRASRLLPSREVSTVMNSSKTA